MPNKGRLLESIVAFMEKNLAPHNVVVTSPERFYRNGKQIGEIDVTLRGNIGSSKFFVGIECRDRPSTGPQGIDWIETIVGKRRFLGVDKMVAVSATGFLPEALQAAKQMNVDAMTVTDVSDVHLSHPMSLAKFSLVANRYEFENFSCECPADEAENFKANLRIANAITGSGRVSALGSYVFSQFDRVLKYHGRGVSVDNGSAIVERETPLRVSVHGREFNIENVSVSARIWQQSSEGQVLLTAYQRAESNEVVAHTGVCRITFFGEELLTLCSLKNWVVAHEGYSWAWNAFNAAVEP